MTLQVRFIIYTFIRHKDRIQQRSKQTDRQTDRQKKTLQLILQHLSNAHSIEKEKSHSTCPKMLIHNTRFIGPQ